MIFCAIQLPPVNCPSTLSFPSLPQKRHPWPWIVSIQSTNQMETWPEKCLNQWKVMDSLIDVITIFFLPFQIYLSPSWYRPLGLICMAWLMQPLALWLPSWVWPVESTRRSKDKSGTGYLLPNLFPGIQEWPSTKGKPQSGDTPTHSSPAQILVATLPCSHSGLGFTSSGVWCYPLWVFLAPHPYPCKQSIRLSSNYPIRVYHLFPAGTLTDTVGRTKFSLSRRCK